MSNLQGDWPTSDRLSIDGCIVTRAVGLSAGGRWWPVASVQLSPSTAAESVRCDERDLQDSPQLAMIAAHRLARDWIRARRA